MICIQDITSQKQEEEKKLELQEKFYHRLILNTSDIFSVLEKDGTFRYISESINEMCGYIPDKLVGLKITDIIHKDDVRSFERFYQNLITKQGRSQPFEYRFLSKDGFPIPVESVGNNLLKEPEIEGVILTTRNISERKKTEEKLLASEEHFRTIVSSMSEMIFLLDESDQFVEAQVPKASDLYVPQKEFIGKTIESVLPPHIVLSYQKAAKKIRKDTTSQQFEYTLEIKGKPRWYYAILDLHPDGKSIIVSIRDVTLQKEAEKQTNKITKYLQNVINSTLEIIIVIDSEKKVTLWNERAIDFTGYQLNDVMGKKLTSLPLFFDQDELDRSIHRCYQEGSYSFTHSLKTALLGRRLLHFSSSLITDDAKETMGIILVGRDITEEGEIHGALIRGKSYLISDETNEEFLHLFFDIIDRSSPGLILTRLTSGLSRTDHRVSNCDILYFDAGVQKKDYVYTPDDVLRSITEFLKSHAHAVVYIDRSDFLFSLYGFEKVMKLLYQLNGLCKSYDAILFVRVNPHILPPYQFKLIQEELSILPKRMKQDDELGSRLYELLEFIYLNNQKNVLISYKMIGRQFSVTKVTTARRVEQLIERGLIIVQQKGRMKTVHITRKGKRLLQRRSIF
jgi:PAS domain S-box-containing protein